MFREMRRKNQQLTYEECAELLKNEPRGVLSLIGDGGYPYGVPIDHYFCEEDGKIYFHSGLKGHKVDAMNSCPKASFCVYDAGFRREDEWALNIKSVIVFGQIEKVTDQEKAMEMVRRLSLKYTDDIDFIERDITSAGARTLVFALVPEHITGKLVNES